MKKDKNILLRAALSIISIFLVIYYWKHITWGIGKFINVANPLIMGAMIAYILNIIMKFYMKKLYFKRLKMRIY